MTMSNLAKLVFVLIVQVRYWSSDIDKHVLGYINDESRNLEDKFSMDAAK